MKLLYQAAARALAIAVCAALSANIALADKPSWAGGGKNGKQEESKQHSGKHDDENGKGGKQGKHGSAASSGHHGFTDQHRVVVRQYYGEQFHAGHCPPGLAKKHNGCMPPGQAKKWQIGRPLPRDVIFYEVPQALVVQIGLPPPGYRYVRVASDILMIAVGSAMVVDAIQDLGRL